MRRTIGGIFALSLCGIFIAGAHEVARGSTVVTDENTPAPKIDTEKLPLGLISAPHPVNEADYINAKTAMDWAKSAKVVEFGQPIAIYSLNAALIEKGDGPDAAIATHELLYTVMADGQDIGQIRVQVDPTTQQAKPDGASFAVNGSSSNLAKIINTIAEMSEVRSGTYEIRELILEWQHRFVLLLWLRDNPGGGDLIYPLYPIDQTNISAHTLYKVAEFMKLLHAGMVGTITGVVVNSDHAPVPNADVTVRIDSRSQLFAAKTDSNGAFILGELPAGTEFCVIATSTNLIGLEQGGALPAGNVIHLPHPIVLGQPGSISGRVLDQHGQPAIEATIAYLQPRITLSGSLDLGLDPNVIDVGGNISGNTDAQGNFVIPGLPAGKYVVTAVLRHGAGETPQFGSIQPIELQAGEEFKLNQPLKLELAGAISGKVLDENGHPAAKATVYVGESSAINSLVTTLTDDQGYFQFKDLSPGTYGLHVRFSTLVNGSTPHLETNEQTSVEVSAGTETKLPNPITLKQDLRLLGRGG